MDEHNRVAVAANVYTEAEVAEFLGIKITTLRNQRTRGAGPPFLKLGNTLLYGMADFHGWVKSSRRVPKKAPTLIDGDVCRDNAV